MKTKQKHTYDYEIDITSDTAQANVLRLVGHNKRVLEIGCGPGSVTKILCKQLNCKVTGIELDSEAIKLAAPYCERIMRSDLNFSEWPHLVEDVEKFDVVIAADVLEHLYDPLKTLQNMVPLINSDGCIIISLPLVSHAAVMSCLINGDFEYKNFGLLDRTHIRFFGLKNIETLFAQAQLKIIEAKYIVKMPEETELALNWSKLSSSFQNVLMRSKYSELYQVVVRAVPFSYDGVPVSLTPPELNKWRIINANYVKLKIFVCQYLSPESIKFVRDILTFFKHIMRKH